jgi:solute:Na+ symporter, SSS family
VAASVVRSVAFIGTALPLMQPEQIDWTATGVFVFFFFLVTILGFVAARWRAADLRSLLEWGLAGRQFGTIITWFLVGGDAYTAYTVIAVPALVYAVGAYGFFAIPYAILIYPLVFWLMPRFWVICHQKNHITAADLVMDRFTSRLLATAVAITGIIATMPYIALQLVGMQVVIAELGISAKELPLIIAFLILALYTYTSGLRAPAMIAFVKDLMIYVVVFVAITYIPFHLGGYQAIFAASQQYFAPIPRPVGLTLHPTQIAPFATTAFGSALAFLAYPHVVTGFLSASSPETIRKNAVLLPIYSILLAFVALLGFMAIAAGVRVSDPNLAVPALFRKMFPSWFMGFSFAAIAIGALVPAAIMSIGSANLFTRNIWRPFVDPALSGARESTVAKVVSLIVKVGALGFILSLPRLYAIDFQLLGGVWILQIFPAIVLALFRHRIRANAIFAGWLVGICTGSWLAWLAEFKSIFTLAIGSQTFSIYIGVLALGLNLLVCLCYSLAERLLFRVSVVSDRRGQEKSITG